MKSKRYRFSAYIEKIKDDGLYVFVLARNVNDLRAGTHFRSHAWLYWSLKDNPYPPSRFTQIEFSATKQYYRRTYKNGKTCYKIGLRDIFFIKEIDDQ